MITESEKLFESYCSNQGIDFSKIEESNVKTPDYLIKIDDYQLIIELTQFNINDNEKDLTKSILPNKFIVYYPEDEKRIRQKIKDKSDQLKTGKGYPLILMFFDNRSVFSTIDGNSIKYALYGNDESTFGYNKEEGQFMFIETIFGKGKTFTKVHKNYISAIGFMKNLNTKCEIILYHNYFTDIKLDINVCKKLANKQYKIIIESNQQSDWIEINA